MPHRESPAFFQIAIPEDLASIEEIYQAPPKEDPQLILYIQNAHGSYEAQMKIKKLLEYLNQKYDFKLIFVEGAVEKLNPDYLRIFPDAENNEKLADYLAKQGELTGAEYYLMEGPDDIEAVGIEEAGLYRSNYEAFKAVQSVKSDTDMHLDQFERRMQALASRIFTSDTRRLIAEWKKFESGHRDFLPYVKQLAQESKKILGVDLESLFSQVEWPMITRLLVLQSMEKDLNRIQAEKEKTKLVEYLESKEISKQIIDDIRNLGNKTINVARLDANGSKAESMPRDLLERLVEEAEPKGFAFHNYPAFSLYAGYLILQSELESRKLFDEIELLFKKVLDEMTPSEIEKNLVELYRDNELLRKLFHLELTRPEWGRVFYRREWIEPKAMVRRLAAIRSDIDNEARFRMEKNGVSLENPAEDDKTGDGKIEMFSQVFVKGFEFYDFARQRETVFRDRMRKEMAERKINKAVLITGGFHTDGVKDLLREEEVNYGVLMPRLTQSIDNVNYLSSMMENRKTMFDVANLEKPLRQSASALMEVGRSLHYEGRQLVVAVLEAVIKQADNLAAMRRQMAEFAASVWPQILGLQIAQTDQPNTWQLVFAGVAGEAEQRFEMRVDEQPDGHFATVLTRMPEQRDEMRRRDFIPTTAFLAATLPSVIADAAQVRKGPFDLDPNFWNMPLRINNLSWDTPIANVQETHIRALLAQMGLSKDSKWADAFDPATALNFKNNLQKRGLATTARGLIEWFNLIRMVRFLSLDISKDRKEEPTQKLNANHMLTIVHRVWSLMDNPNFDLIPSHVLFMQASTPVQGAGMIHPDDVLFRLYMKKITEGVLYQVQTDSAGMDVKTSLSTIGQNMADAEGSKVAFINSEASLLLPSPVPQIPEKPVDLIPVHTIPNLTRWMITSTDQYQQDMLIALANDERDRARRLNDPGRIPHPLFPRLVPSLQTVADLRLALLVRARAFEMAQALEEDPAFQTQLETNLAITSLYASLNNWEALAQEKYGQPYKPVKVSVTKGDVGYYAHNMLVVAQQLIAAMKVPALFEVYTGSPQETLPKIHAVISRSNPKITTTEISQADPTYNLWMALARQSSGLLDNLNKANTPQGQVKYWKSDIGNDQNGELPMVKHPDSKALENLKRGAGRQQTINRLTRTSLRRELRKTEPVTVGQDLIDAYASVSIGSTFTVPDSVTPSVAITALAGGIAAPEDIVKTLTAFGDSQRQQVAAVPENENLRMMQQALSAFSSNQTGHLGIVTSPPDGATDVFPPEEVDGLATILALNLNQEVALIIVTPTYVDTSAIYQRVEMRMNALFGVVLGNRLTVQAVRKANVLLKRLATITSRWSKRGAAGAKPVFLAEGATADLLNMDTLGGLLIVGFPSTELQGAGYSVLQRFVAAKVSQFADKLDEDTAAVLQKWDRGYKVLVSALQQMMASLSNAWKVLARIRASA